MVKMTSDDTATLLLGIVADLLHGQRHCRRTIREATGRSLQTADRWIDLIKSTIPNTRKEKEGKTTWIVIDRRGLPTKPAVAGACVAASVGSLFAGTQQARNLKDARDFLLQLRDDNYSDLDRKFFFAPKGGEYALPHKSGEFDEIVDALLTNHLVRFSYRHNDDRAEELAVRPLSLVIFDHQLYLLAQREGGARYAFRFARMEDVEAAEQTFEYPTALEYDPNTVFRPHFGINLSSTGAIEDVEILLRGPWANFAMSHKWHQSQHVERLEDGRVRVIVTVHVCREVETWALGFGESAVVVAPASLRERVAVRLAEAAKVYGDDPRVPKATVTKGEVVKARPDRLARDIKRNA